MERILVTAKIDAEGKKTRKMRFNTANIVSYGEGAGSACVIFALDGQPYPVMESPEQIDKLLDALDKKRK